MEISYARISEDHLYLNLNVRRYNELAVCMNVSKGLAKSSTRNDVNLEAEATEASTLLESSLPLVLGHVVHNEPARAMKTSIASSEIRPGNIDTENEQNPTEFQGIR